MNVMTKAHQIRKAAVEKWNCAVSEINFAECLRMAHAKPKVGSKYSSFANGEGIVSLLIKEDNEWLYFDDGMKYNKIFSLDMFLVI